MLQHQKSLTLTKFIFSALLGGLIVSSAPVSAQKAEQETTNVLASKQETDVEKTETVKVETVATYSLSAYIDAYCATYTDSVGPGNYQKFPSVSPRSNSPSLNTAMLTFQYNADKIRTIASLHFGDIANATWPHPYNNLMEAHVGVRLAKKLWLDAGFFRTHFGTEFLLPVENITSSVSVGTFYEPYYESGFRLNFNPTKKLEIDLYFLNGYGVYIDNNEKKSLGTVITYAINDAWGVGYTNYIGDDSKPDDKTKHLRIHQNAYFNFQHKNVKLQVGGDFCIQENSDIATASKNANMYSGVATFRYQLPKAFGVYCRGEVFSDPDAIMSTHITDNSKKETGYKLWGVTAGAEFKPTTNSYVRLEGRMLQMENDQWIFVYNGAPQNNRFEVMVNAGISLDLLKGTITK